MIDLQKLQKDIWQNKIDKGFNTTDVSYEINLLYGEVAEVFEAYKKKEPHLGEELADVIIYLLGLAQMLGVDLKKEINLKVAKNQKREYKKIDGVVTRTKEAE